MAPMSSRQGSRRRRPLRSGIKDIARALGVSTGTVDRALHGKPEVSPATRARVLSMAESLGYRPESRRALPEVAPAAPHLGAAARARSRSSGTRCATASAKPRRRSRRRCTSTSPAIRISVKATSRCSRTRSRDGTNGLIIAPGQSRRTRSAPREGRPPRHSRRLRRHRRAGQSSASRPSRPIRSRSARWPASCWRASCRGAARSRSSRAGSRCRITPTSCAGSRSSLRSMGRALALGADRRSARRRTRGPPAGAGRAACASGPEGHATSAR